MDASLSSTGYAYRSNGSLVTGLITTGKLRGPFRLFYVRTQLQRVLEEVRPDLVLVEGYSLGSRSSSISGLCELGGVIRTLLWEMGIDYIQVPPTSMKLVVAGNGKAKKPEVGLALLNRYGVCITQDDEADAAGLFLTGEMICGYRQVGKLARELKGFQVIMQQPTIKGRLQLISKSK